MARTPNDDISYLREQLGGVKTAVDELKTDLAECRIQKPLIDSLQRAVDELVVWKRDVQSQLFKLIIVVALAALSGGSVATVAKSAIQALFAPAAAQPAQVDRPDAPSAAANP